jgi:hypothetical protein
MAPIDPERLKLSRCPLELCSQPYCFFHTDDFLPPDLYEALYASFPEEPGDFAENTEGRLGLRSSDDPAGFEAFCRAHPEWRELVALFASDAFVLDAQRTFAVALARARGMAGRKRWLNDTRTRVSNDLLRYALFEPVRATFQFSRMPQGAVSLPHTDAPRKLVSLLLYFPDPDWRPEWGGATEFFAPPPAAAGPTERIGFEGLEPVGRAEFRPNRLAGFVRSAASWHGVRPLACPPGRARKALLINLKRVKWSKRHVP